MPMIAPPDHRRQGFHRSRRTGHASSPVLRHRLPMRSSPYVGWFRHAPPSSSSSRRASGTWGVGGAGGGGSRLAGGGRPRSNSLTEMGGSSMGRYRALSGGHPSSSLPSSAALGGSGVHRSAGAPSSVIGMKSSPYVGWFRHAPPSRISPKKVLKGHNIGIENLGCKIKTSGMKGGCVKGKALGGDDVEALLKLLQRPSFKMNRTTAQGGGRRHSHFYVDGKLRGGHPLHEGENDDGVFPFDGDPTMTTPFDHRRAFDSLHQSASTRGLHFNFDGMAQDEEDEDVLSGCDGGRNSSPSGNDDDDDDLDDSSQPSSATVGVLNRLAHWFLFPMAPPPPHEGDSSTRFPYEDYARRSSASDAADVLYGHVGPGVTTALFPLFSGMLLRALHLEDGEAFPTEGRQGDEGRDDDDDDNDLTSEVDSQDNACDNASDTSEDRGSEQQRAGTGRASATAHLLDVSVSSLAEAYYAHQASREFLEAAELASGLGTAPLSSSHSSPPPSLSSSPAGEHGLNHHPLDYVITQIDIARMVRNASRHLDVESILSLPTVTYQAKKKKKKKQKKKASNVKTNEDEIGNSQQRGVVDEAGNQENKTDDFAWSWMIVPEDPERAAQAQAQDPAFTGGPKASSPSHDPQVPSSLSATADDEDEDEDDGDGDDEHCVICLEHFVEGDRLRVLPCSHLFHAGCIDRWLSGAASDEECFTAGCPTCKERPVSSSSSHSQSMQSSSRAGCGGKTASGAGSSGEEEGLLAGDNGGNNGRSSSLDGSVPSWAFARLGDAMAGRSSASSSAAPVP